MSEPARRARLILVEDSDDAAELIARALRAGGVDAEIERAETLADLEAALGRERPDAVIADYRLPGFEAPQALAAVRAFDADLPFLCVSGTIGEEQAVDLLKAGATDYALKGKPARLVAVLRRALAEARERVERRRAEEALRLSREQFLQAQKMEAVGRLAGGVAHDFNNILTTISGYGELLLQSLPKNSPCVEDVREIVLAAERGARLTRQLLAFGRRQVLEVRVLDLNAVVRDVERLLRRVIGEDVKIVLSLSPEIRRIRADAGQIEQVLMNLAVNARDAMPRGGTFAIATRPAGERVELRVSDDGEGMAEETAARAFEPFFTTKEKGKGTGLGLATVHGIVLQSDGEISIESAPGRGAAFRILLPGTDEHAEFPRAAAPRAPAPTPGAARPA
ncbi:MAG: response regulator, partial [Elusimicrobia bacterium]|nr:response regulator [Elusimicrobiota bacterium]